MTMSFGDKMKGDNPKMYEQLFNINFHFLNHNELSTFVELCRFMQNGKIKYSSLSELRARSEKFQSHGLSTFKNTLIKLRALGWLSQSGDKKKVINKRIFPDNELKDRLKMYVRSVTVAEHTKLMTSRDEIKKKVAEYNDVGFGKRLAPPKKAICIEQNDEYSSLQVMRIMGKSRLSHFQVDFFLKLIAICDENGECYAKNTHQFWLENADRLCRAQTTLNHCLTILQNENWIKVETCLGVLVITINPILLSNPYTSSILSHFVKHEVTVGCYTLFCSIANLVEADGHYRSRTLINDCCFKELKIGRSTIALYINELAHFGFIKKLSMTHISINKKLWK